MYAHAFILGVFVMLRFLLHLSSCGNMEYELRLKLNMFIKFKIKDKYFTFQTGTFLHSTLIDARFLELLKTHYTFRPADLFNRKPIHISCIFMVCKSIAVA